MTIRKSQSSLRRPLMVAVAATAVVLTATVACGGCSASAPPANPSMDSTPESSSLDVLDGTSRAAQRAATLDTPEPIVLGPAAERTFALAPPVPVPDEPRTLRFLEGTLDQMARLERAIGNGTGAQRFSHGSLAAALLARAADDPEERQRLTSEARRTLTRALDICSGGGWGRNDCFRAAPVMERVALSAPEIVGEDLRRRLADQLRDPGDAPVGGPWGFGETENQRAVRLATGLGYLALHWQLAGGDESEPSPRRARQIRQWSDATVEYLAARDEQGWYEQDSPGYLATSIEALTHLADFAPDPLVRDLSSRQLSVLLAGWAQRQVRGFPAGAKTRTYQHWALSPRNTPWQAWYWWLTGDGADAGGRQGLNFLDAPILPASGYQVPEAVTELLTNPVSDRPYELRERRRIDLASRRNVDGAIYTWVAPDYTLSTAQAVDGLALGISGGQEIMATLYADCTPFAPIYLWSRTRAPRSERWRSWTDSDRAAASGPVALAQLGDGSDSVKGALGHAYLDADWEAPRPLGNDTVTVRCGDVYAALTAPGGFEVAEAQSRFGDYYGEDPTLAGSRVAIPRRAGGPIALEVSSAREVGDYEAFRQTIADGSELRGVGDGPAVAYRSAAGRELVFDPGTSLAVDGQKVEARDYPLLAGPRLTGDDGVWTFTGRDGGYRLPVLERPTAAEERPDP